MAVRARSVWLSECRVEQRAECMHRAEPFERTGDGGLGTTVSQLRLESHTYTYTHADVSCDRYFTITLHITTDTRRDIVCVRVSAALVGGFN